MKLNEGVPVPPAWAAEVELIVEQLGVLSFRTALVDMARMAALRVWTVGEKARLPEAVAAGGPLETAFPGAAARLAELAEVAGEVEGHTTVTRVSQRRCLFVWRKDLQHAMVAEARYRQAPAQVGEIDKSLVRLLSQIALSKHEATPSPGEAARTADTKTAPAGHHRTAAERSVHAGKSARSSRHHAHEPSLSDTWMVWSGRFLLLLGAVAAAWLLLNGLPAVHDQAVALGAANLRLQSQVEESMARSLAPMLAAGDAEALQATLADRATRRYLEAAAVSNDKDRVVATHGPTLGLKAGALAVSPIDARGVDLNQGKQRIGRLWLIGAPPEVAVPATAHLVASTWLAAFAFALGSALLAGQRWLRRHRL